MINFPSDDEDESFNPMDIPFSGPNIEFTSTWSSIGVQPQSSPNSSNPNIIIEEEEEDEVNQEEPVQSPAIYYPQYILSVHTKRKNKPKVKALTHPLLHFPYVVFNAFHAADDTRLRELITTYCTEGCSFVTTAMNPQDIPLSGHHYVIQFFESLHRSYPDGIITIQDEPELVEISPTTPSSPSSTLFLHHSERYSTTALRQQYSRYIRFSFIFVGTRLLPSSPIRSHIQQSSSPSISHSSPQHALETVTHATISKSNSVSLFSSFSSQVSVPTTPIHTVNEEFMFKDPEKYCVDYMDQDQLNDQHVQSLRTLEDSYDHLEIIKEGKVCLYLKPKAVDQESSPLPSSTSFPSLSSSSSSKMATSFSSTTSYTSSTSTNSNVTNYYDDVIDFISIDMQVISISKPADDVFQSTSESSEENIIIR